MDVEKIYKALIGNAYLYANAPSVELQDAARRVMAAIEQERQEAAQTSATSGAGGEPQEDEASTPGARRSVCDCVACRKALKV